MKKLNKKLLCFCALLSSVVCTSLYAGESFIPLQKGLRIASDDLIYNNQILSSRDADLLNTNQKIDLSTLNPKSNDIWDKSISVVSDQSAISIKDNDTLTFEGSLLSNTGLFRFNAIPVNGNKIYTIHLDKSLHTMLMRKNLLRSLGYKIPAMKYLKTVTIKFDSKFSMETFLKSDIPEATLGASERWAKSNESQLTVTLKDIAVTEPNEFDFYNVSMGIPTQVINSRSLRALVIPYSLVDLYESVNKFSWVDGKLDNKAIILSHFTNNEFATTVDDAVWMLNKLNKLSRVDYQRIVAEAYFPKEVELLLVEKLISRRNALNKVFNLKTEEIKFNPIVTLGSGLKNGKVVQKDYPDYASRFAYGDAESPLEQIRFFLYSKVQSNIIDNLVNKLNGEMSFFDLNDKRTDYFQKQFKDGLDHFVDTGELLPIKVGVWYAPAVNVNLILSRDIVLGNYLGTDNLVQLADTFGASAEIGVFAGIEGIGADLAGSAKASVSLVRSFSHVKPVKSLKQSLKEPFKNIFVSLLKKSLKDNYFSLSELKSFDDKNTTDEVKEDQKKKIEGIFKEIDKTLDVGESLILTDRLVPSASVRISFNQGLIGAGVGVSGGVTILKRVHLYKKSAKILQIYDDSGFVKNIDISLFVSNYINLVKVNASMDNGHYRVNSYMVNLSTDLSENPNLFSNALGVYNVLKNKDFEILDANNPPVKLDVQFKDKETGLSLLFWRVKSLSGKTYYDVKAKDGVVGTYFSLEKDFLTGLNPEAFSKQLMNYYIAKDVEDIQISDDEGPNPGESFFGRSRTQKLRYEAAVDANKKFTQKFLDLADVKQGWGMNESTVRKFMENVNKKFQAPLFDPGQIDFKKLRLYNIGYHMNLYNKGIERLHKVTVKDILPLEVVYKKERRLGCNTTDSGDAKKRNPNLKRAICGDLTYLKNIISRCQRPMSDEKMAECSTELLEQMFNDMKFTDFKNLIGEDNLYIYGSIDGFREKSEILNDTIYSNTIGKIGSKQWSGPLEVVRDLLGLSDGEFSGSWIRKGL
jgi:hypothetical protein